MSQRQLRGTATARGEKAGGELQHRIEKKPLQAIGLVAGALVAVVYWTVAVIHHFI